ncbi:hypothetical protein DITRI_Ditri18aG0077900 [Diplodiscus trichospermus]
MSHRKVHSQGNIPFSWEDKPGISKSFKVTHNDQYCPIDVGFCAHNQTTPADTSESSTKILVHDKKVPPPPPCSIQQPPKRSTSVKGLRWWQEDPFLAAYKVCTKSGGNGKLPSEGRKNGGSKLLVRKKRITFSCKDSSDVRDDNLVILSHLPRLPKDRSRGRQEFVQPLEEYW